MSSSYLNLYSDEKSSIIKDNQKINNNLNFSIHKEKEEEFLRKNKSFLKLRNLLIGYNFFYFNPYFFFFI